MQRPLLDVLGGEQGIRSIVDIVLEQLNQIDPEIMQSYLQNANNEDMSQFTAKYSYFVMA